MCTWLVGWCCSEHLAGGMVLQCAPGWWDVLHCAPGWWDGAAVSTWLVGWCCSVHLAGGMCCIVHLAGGMVLQCAPGWWDGAAVCTWLLWSTPQQRMNYCSSYKHQVPDPSLTTLAIWKSDEQEVPSVQPTVLHCVPYTLGIMS